MEVWCDLAEKFVESGGLPWISTKACDKWMFDVAERESEW
jgi:hypothetical protein